MEFATETERLFYDTLTAIIEEAEKKGGKKSQILTFARGAIDHFIIAKLAGEVGKNRRS